MDDNRILMGDTSLFNKVFYSPSVVSINIISSNLTVHQ